MYSEASKVPARAEQRTNYLSNDKFTTSQPLISVALESVGSAVKEVTDLSQVVSTIADSLVGTLPLLPTNGNGEAVRQAPSFGRGGNLVQECQQLHEVLVVLREQINRLHVL